MSLHMYSSCILDYDLLQTAHWEHWEHQRCIFLLQNNINILFCVHVGTWWLLFCFCLAAVLFGSWNETRIVYLTTGRIQLSSKHTHTLLAALNCLSGWSCSKDPEESFHLLSSGQHTKSLVRSIKSTIIFPSVTPCHLKPSGSGLSPSTHRTMTKHHQQLHS